MVSGPGNTEGIIPPQEGREVSEVKEQLDRAAFEPEAVVERFSDIKQAEDVQEAFVAVVPLTNASQESTRVEIPPPPSESASEGVAPSAPPPDSAVAPTRAEAVQEAVPDLAPIGSNFVDNLSPEQNDALEGIIGLDDTGTDLDGDDGEGTEGPSDTNAQDEANDSDISGGTPPSTSPLGTSENENLSAGGSSEDSNEGSSDEPLISSISPQDISHKAQTVMDNIAGQTMTVKGAVEGLKMANEQVQALAELLAELQQEELSDEDYAAAQKASQRKLESAQKDKGEAKLALDKAIKLSGTDPGDDSSTASTDINESGAESSDEGNTNRADSETDEGKNTTSDADSNLESGQPRDGLIDFTAISRGEDVFMSAGSLAAPFIPGGSVLSAAMGGGGHKPAAGAEMEGGSEDNSDGVISPGSINNNMNNIKGSGLRVQLAQPQVKTTTAKSFGDQMKEGLQAAEEAETVGESEIGETALPYLSGPGSITVGGVEAASLDIPEGDQANINYEKSELRQDISILREEILTLQEELLDWPDGETRTIGYRVIDPNSSEVWEQTKTMTKDEAIALIAKWKNMITALEKRLNDLS